MEQWHYAVAGLRVVSKLRIPEWESFEQAQRVEDEDVLIVLAGEALREDEIGILTATDYRFHISGTGSYRVRDGREISVAPAPEADMREVRLFLLGSAWGALCYQRGLLVLHASAVRVRNEAVAFCAPQHMGKSTLAAWLNARGYPLVSDDLARLDIPACGPPTIYPSAPRLKLWREALDGLGWNHAELVRDHFRDEKFHVTARKGEALLASRENASPIPLREICLLAWGESNIIRLRGIAGLLRFISAATYRPGLLEPMGRMGPYWQQCLELMRRVPVRELRRPRDLAAMNATSDLLIKHWETA